MKSFFVWCCGGLGGGGGGGGGGGQSHSFLCRKIKQEDYTINEKEIRNPATSLTVFVWNGEVGEESNLKIQFVHCVFSTQLYFHRLHMLLKDRRDSFIKCFKHTNR